MLGHRLKKLPTLRQPGQFAYDVGAVRKIDDVKSTDPSRETCGDVRKI
jgi:hypothetical protein